MTISPKPDHHGYYIVLPQLTSSPSSSPLFGRPAGALICVSAVLALMGVVGCGDDAVGCPGGAVSCQLGVDSGNEADVGADAAADLSADPDNGADAMGDGNVQDQGPDSAGGADAGEDLAVDVQVDGWADDTSFGLDTDDDVVRDGFTLAALPNATFAYVEVGDSVADLRDVRIEVYELGDEGSEGNLSFSVGGPFAVSGDTGPMDALETRIITLSFTGSTVTRGIYTETLMLGADGQTVRVNVAAVVGDPDIPTGVWTPSPYGTRAVLDLPSAPFPHAGDPWTDSTVLVVVPDGLTDFDGVNILTHIHGHNAVIEDRIAQQQLVELHTHSGRNAVFIAPQGPVSAASGDFGNLHEPGGFANLVDDVLMLLYRDGFIERPIPGEIAVSSHSGGYKAAADIAELGGLPITAILLYDSLYGRESQYQAFVQGGGIFRSNYTAGGGTGDENVGLETTLEGLGITVGNSFSDRSLVGDDVVIGASPSVHNECMYADRTAARWMTASDLPPRLGAPPDLTLVEQSAGSVNVRWRRDRGAPNAVYRVQMSDDLDDWVTVAEGAGTSATFDSPEVGPYLQLVRYTPGWGDSAPSDAYGTSTGDTLDTWLVVDGFDRVLGGSWLDDTHDFAGRVGAAAGVDFDVASNEAVIDGEVSLGDYDGVVWLLGDESADDVTFDVFERELIKDHVTAGGTMIVSGAEVGYGSDRAWLSQVLHATYVSDDAGTLFAGGYEFGTLYDEDYPDVLSGDTTIWSYAGGGGAAVGWNTQIIVVGFPLEGITEGDLPAAMGELLDWL